MERFLDFGKKHIRRAMQEVNDTCGTTSWSSNDEQIGMAQHLREIGNHYLIALCMIARPAKTKTNCFVLSWS